MLYAAPFLAQQGAYKRATMRSNPLREKIIFLKSFVSNLTIGS